MEKYLLEEDLHLICEPAKKFPEGIVEAQEKLRQKITVLDGERRLFGISRPNEQGIIAYKAAVEGNSEEAEKIQCETFILKKGTYISTKVTDFTQDISQIGKTFQTLLDFSGIDRQGCCVEIYEGEKDVLCMVRLSSE